MIAVESGEMTIETRIRSPSARYLGPLGLQSKRECAAGQGENIS
jgi:hypothetical protein